MLSCVGEGSKGDVDNSAQTPAQSEMQIKNANLHASEIVIVKYIVNVSLVV